MESSGHSQDCQDGYLKLPVWLQHQQTDFFSFLIIEYLTVLLIANCLAVVYLQALKKIVFISYPEEVKDPIVFIAFQAVCRLKSSTAVIIISCCPRL